KSFNESFLDLDDAATQEPEMVEQVVPDSEAPAEEKGFFESLLDSDEDLDFEESAEEVVPESEAPAEVKGFFESLLENDEGDDEAQQGYYANMGSWDSSDAAFANTVVSMDGHKPDITQETLQNVVVDGVKDELMAGVKPRVVEQLPKASEMKPGYLKNRLQRLTSKMIKLSVNMRTSLKGLLDKNKAKGASHGAPVKTDSSRRWPVFQDKPVDRGLARMCMRYRKGTHKAAYGLRV